MDGNVLGVGDQAVTTLVQEIQKSSEKPILIEIERGGILKEITLILDQEKFSIHLQFHSI